MTAKLFVLGTLAGALTLFAWEAISNTVIPWHAPTMRSFSDSNAVVQTIKANAPGNGMYVDARGVVAAVAFTADGRDRSTLIGLMLGRQLALDVVVAFVVLLAFQRFPRASTAQYAHATAVLAFAVSASILASNWNWYGFGIAWTVVNIVDRTIGYGLLGLVLGALMNKWSRVNTDEWGGIRAPTGPPSGMSAPKRSSGG